MNISTAIIKITSEIIIIYCFLGIKKFSFFMEGSYSQ